MAVNAHRKTDGIHCLADTGFVRGDGRNHDQLAFAIAFNGGRIDLGFETTVRFYGCGSDSKFFCYL